MYSSFLTQINYGLKNNKKKTTTKTWYFLDHKKIHYFQALYGQRLKTRQGAI